MPTPGTVSISEGSRVTQQNQASWGTGSQTKTFFAATESAARNLWATSGFILDRPQNPLTQITYSETTPNPAFTTYTYEIIP